MAVQDDVVVGGGGLHNNFWLKVEVVMVMLKVVEGFDGKRDESAMTKG